MHTEALSPDGTLSLTGRSVGKPHESIDCLSQQPDAYGLRVDRRLDEWILPLFERKNKNHRTVDCT